MTANFLRQFPLVSFLSPFSVCFKSAKAMISIHYKPFRQQFQDYEEQLNDLQ